MSVEILVPQGLVGKVADVSALRDKIPEVSAVKIRRGRVADVLELEVSADLDPGEIADVRAQAAGIVDLLRGDTLERRVVALERELEQLRARLGARP